MVLMAITGTLGSGKTLSLTYLAVRNFLKGKKIFSNYHLNIPYTYIEKPEDIDIVREGVFLGDELWAWLDSRAFGQKRNRVLAEIILKSRKRGYEIIYTTQDFSQIDKRIRKITDFIAEPLLYPNNSLCILRMFDKRSGKFIKQIKFKPKAFYDFYDTKEEIDSF